MPPHERAFVLNLVWFTGSSAPRTGVRLCKSQPARPGQERQRHGVCSSSLKPTFSFLYILRVVQRGIRLGLSWAGGGGAWSPWEKPRLIWAHQCHAESTLSSSFHCLGLVSCMGSGSMISYRGAEWAPGYHKSKSWADGKGRAVLGSGGSWPYLEFPLKIFYMPPSLEESLWPPAAACRCSAPRTAVWAGGRRWC